MAELLAASEVLLAVSMQVDQLYTSINTNAGGWGHPSSQQDADGVGA
jgi:hypothetical protein